MMHLFLRICEGEMGGDVMEEGERVKQHYAALKIERDDSG
jgi:hypothetical protein